MEILVDGYIQVIQEWGDGRNVHRPGIEGQGVSLGGGGAILGHMEFAVTTHTRNAGGTRCRDVPCMWYG